MSERQARRPTHAVAHRTPASARFRGYKDERQRSLREKDVEGCEVLSRINEAYKRSFEIVESFNLWFLDGISHPMERFMPVFYPALYEIGISSDDIYRFSLSLDETWIGKNDDFDSRCLKGLFLSAMVKLNNLSITRLHMKAIGGRLNLLGCGNSGILTIDGDVGIDTGHGMSEGLIVIKGNTGEATGSRMSGGAVWVDGCVKDYAGHKMRGGFLLIEKDAGNNLGHEMEDGWIYTKGDCGNSVGARMGFGNIVVKGNVRDHLGEYNEGGEITVHGNAGVNVGELMTGGDIHINGEIGSIGNVKGGRIYHKGKLIVDEG
jgi:formylmethanofuran dehydrogenase subunit C